MPSTEGRLARDVSVLLCAIPLSSILKCKSTVKRAERSHRVCASVGPCVDGKGVGKIYTRTGHVCTELLYI